ncbi:MAG TPA: helix-turn-helix domain-containing protein [Planctomycetota bacterium]|nr:helix-turn-helix domain-containing protein [Planctomycetota bacterium]
MIKKPETTTSGEVVVKRKRGRPRGTQEVVSEQAAAYGITVPVLTDTGERFLSPNDIGKILNVTGEAVKQWIYRRKLPAVKLANGYWKVKVVDFEQFLKARTEVGRRHVLITDGGHCGVAELAKAVDELGHQPVLAHNYSDALLKALDHFPALFIICIAPNDPDAWKFAERIRSNKSLRSFPILFIGGSTISDEDTERAVKYYAQGILSRPLDIAVIKSEIERILQRTM